MFATLFPDKVERLVIDGIVDLQGYYNGASSELRLDYILIILLFPSADWSRATIDSEKSLQYFFDQCHAAGASRCPFYADSPTKISQRLDAIISKVKAQPVPVYNSGDPVYGVLDYAILKNGLFQSLYSPSATYFTLAQGLVDLERGNGTLLLKLGALDPHGTELVGAIACSDGKKVTDDAAALQRYYDSFKDSSMFASHTGQIRISCSCVEIIFIFTRYHPNFYSPVAGRFIVNSKVRWAESRASLFSSSAILLVSYCSLDLSTPSLRTAFRYHYSSYRVRF